MANTRGKTSLHGPSTTGGIHTTSPAGSYTPAAGSGAHGPGTPNVPAGSGANGGKVMLVGSGAVGAGARTPTASPGAKGVNAGNKTIVGEGAKKPAYTSGNGVGANTPYKRKKQRRLGTSNGNTPA